MTNKPILILEDIASQLEETMDCWTQYFNTETGEFVSLSDGSYIEVDEELADEIDSSDCYIQLPGQYDIREYSIMEAFAEATPDAGKRERLFRALKGPKPYRTFKDTINYVGLDEAYYAFRYLEYVNIAKEWCEEHDLSYRIRSQAEEDE